MMIQIQIKKKYKFQKPLYLIQAQTKKKINKVRKYNFNSQSLTEGNNT